MEMFQQKKSSKLKIKLSYKKYCELSGGGDLGCQGGSGGVTIRDDRGRSGLFDNNKNRAAISFKLPIVNTNNNHKHKETSKNQDSISSKESKKEKRLSEGGGGGGGEARGSQSIPAVNEGGKSSLRADGTTEAAAAKELPILPPIIKESLVSYTTEEKRRTKPIIKQEEM